MRLAAVAAFGLAIGWSLTLAAQTLKIPESTPVNPETAQLPEAPIPQCPNGRIQDKVHPDRCIMAINIYDRFLSVPTGRPLTPKEKAVLAAHNVFDPFNAATILLIAGISVASDSHSVYGPGMPGFGRVVGVAYTQDITGNFFGTFLIPSIVHQDPHYHRMPAYSVKRRIWNAVSEPEWAISDKGAGMPNYAFIVGTFIDGEISNLYIPGRHTNASATAQRYFSGFYLAPVDNMVTEFLPDVARKLHIRIFLVQWVVNHIAGTTSNTP